MACKLDQPINRFIVEPLVPTQRLAATRHRGDDLRPYAEALMSLSEEHRRAEVGVVPAAPVSGLLDYAAAGIWLDNALAHLDEGLPLGQATRCEASLNLAVLGLQSLCRWMRARGYNNIPLLVIVHPEADPTDPAQALDLCHQQL